VSVKYNFFDWGVRSRDKQVAIERDFIQKDNLDSQLLALKSNINQLKINIEQIQRNFDLSKELFALETTNLELIEREYRNGKIQYLDLVTGLSNYSDAEIRYFTAISDLQNARYTFLYHQGKLYDELIK
jgi:outer membrane protein TolC